MSEFENQIDQHMKNERQQLERSAFQEDGYDENYATTSDFQKKNHRKSRSRSHDKEKRKQTRRGNGSKSVKRDENRTITRTDNKRRPYVLCPLCLKEIRLDNLEKHQRGNLCQE